MFRSTLFAAAASAVLFASANANASVASAEDFASNGRTSPVYHGDLDLSNPAHQAQLRSRIARAAKRVCSGRDLATEQACKAKAIARVEAPISAAIARAETSERYADARGKDGLPLVAN